MTLIKSELTNTRSTLVALSSVLYGCLLLKSSALAPRWQNAGVATLIRLERHRQHTGVVSQSVSYFVCNIRLGSQSALVYRSGASQTGHNHI